MPIAQSDTRSPYDKAVDKMIDEKKAESAPLPFKYKEKELLEEFAKYVEGTYGQHYVGEDNVQSLDLIFSSKHGVGFCIGNILKYAARWGKKKGCENDDLMKILHYALLLRYLYIYKGATVNK